MVNIDLLIESTRELFRKAYDAVRSAWDAVTSWAPGGRDAWDAVNEKIAELQSTVNFLKNIVLKGPSVILDTIGQIVNAIGNWLSSMFWGISGLAWQYTGPLAPIVLVILAGGLIWASLWIAKRLYELL